MKITLDLDKLLQEGRITQAEYDKFSQLSARTTSALAFNILVGFGVVAVGGATLALLPTTATAIGLGLAVGVLGGSLLKAQNGQWRLLANICVAVGALLFGGGIIAQGEGSVAAFLMVALVFAAAGAASRSALLTVLAVLALASCLGARTGYFHATYFLGIQEPGLTVATFSAFSMVAYWLSTKLPADYQGIATVAARTGAFLVNFGFWVGSLWGDGRQDAAAAFVIPDWAFAVLWALALALVGVWAWQKNLRWLVNVVAVFAGIHFYTQWFERLEVSPQMVLLAGLLALGFALGLRALNAKLGSED